MEKQEVFNEIKSKSEKIGICINDEKCEKFWSYMNLLIEWNQKMNLTAIVEPKEVILKHFIDSITIDKYLQTGIRMIDVGTGAGFPGMPERILRDDIEVILADSLNKRLNFLNEVINQLELKKISTVHGRAEELAHNKEYRECFDVVTSRAVAQLNVLTEYMLPFAKVGGICICMKGNNVEEELRISEKAINELGGRIENVETFNLPESDITRNIVIIKKVKETNEKYPRKAGTPAKEPII